MTGAVPDAGTRRGSDLEAAIGGGVLGALLGAAVGGSRGDLIAAAVGASAGAAAGAILEVMTERSRVPAAPKPEWHRIGMAAWFAAAVGGLVDLAAPPFAPVVFTVPLGLTIGLVGTVGLLTFRRNRPVLGLLVGLGVGVVATALTGDAWLAPLAALVALGYRVIGRFWFGGRDMAELLGEQLEREQVPFVAPYTSRSGRVGTEWPARTASELGWTHEHNPRGIGLVVSLEELRGPRFDPDAVAPAVRDFYEHTSDYVLTITPVWNRRAQALYARSLRLWLQDTGMTRSQIGWSSTSGRRRRTSATTSASSACRSTP